MSSLITYLKNVRGEMNHVVWPDKKQAATHTLLIILVSALVAVFIAALDYMFSGALNQLISGY